MGYILAFIPYLIQLCLIIHVIKNGNQFFWIWLIVFVPYIGGLIYLIMEVIPNLRVKNTVSNLENTFRPSKKIKDLESLVRRQETVTNIVELADAYAEMENNEKAIELYESCLSGPYEKDTEIIFKITKAYFNAGKIEEAKEKLKVYLELNGTDRINDISKLIIILQIQENYEKLRDMFFDEYNFEAGYNLLKYYIKNEKQNEAEAIVAEMKNIRKDYPLYKKGNNAKWYSLSVKLL